MATLSFSITVPDAKQNEIIDYVARSCGWTSDSPETKSQFVRSAVVKFLKDHYRAFAVTDAMVVAKSSASTAVDAVVIE